MIDQAKDGDRVYMHYRQDPALFFACIRILIFLV